MTHLLATTEGFGARRDCKRDIHSGLSESALQLLLPLALGSLALAEELDAILNKISKVHCIDPETCVPEGIAVHTKNTKTYTIM